MKNGVIGVTIMLALIAPALLHAQVVITEIMYDPVGADSGHEWIELYNESTSSISLTHWKVVARDASHNIIAVSSSSTIPSFSYAVIAQNAGDFRAQYPDFSVPLFHSAFSLDNAGDTLQLLDASATLVDSATYDSSEGALGDGNSLQRDVGGDEEDFTPHIPTPGTAIVSDLIAPPPITGPTATKVKTLKSYASTHKKNDDVTSGVSSSDDASSPRSADSSPSSLSAVSVAAASKTSGCYLALALLGIIVIVIISIVMAHSLRKREWDIVEEINEDV